MSTSYSNLLQLQQEKSNNTSEQHRIKDVLQKLGISEKITQEFMGILKRGDVAEIMTWCKGRKDPSVWTLIAATIVPDVAGQNTIAYKTGPNSESNKVAAARSNFFHESASKDIAQEELRFTEK